MSGYRHEDTAALVLAAGMGKRMNSDLAKVLHPMAGRPLLAHVLATLDELGVGRRVVVIGHQRERVQAAFAGRDDLEWAIQAEQRGTGHACMMAEPSLGEFGGTLLVVCGDTPLLTARTLHALLETHASSGASVTVLSMRLPDPHGYGRIVRSADGVGIERIVEEKDATPAQRAIDEVNSGIYAFRYPSLTGVLSKLTAANSQGEYYLTDTVSLLQERGERAAVVCADDHRELLGINTVDQLSEAEAVWLDMRKGRA
ncbi:MAG: NTP transferase domain-containing protein [Candidatus Eisenbacteria bacterium]|nr:NTP transferase domain-containing protein [Candidatus Eisenbacteria bacterium]